MKAIYAFLIFILIGSLFCYKSILRVSIKAKQTTAKAEDNPYNSLRILALEVTAEQLQLKLSEEGKPKIYGVVMDWGLDDGTATLVSFTTGDASLYLSSGGGFIGGGGNDKVKKAANDFIERAETYLDQAIITKATPLPGKGGLTFYFLTNKGKFKATEQMNNIQAGNSPWLGLFEAGNKLITELKDISESTRLE